jgi:hypothetical protein
MGKITQEVRVVPTKAPPRSLLQRIFRRRKKPTVDNRPDAQVIPLDPHRRRRSPKRNDFKPQLGKGKGMVEEEISEEDKLRKEIKDLQAHIKELEGKNKPESDLINGMIKSAESRLEDAKHQLNGYTKQDIIAYLKAAAPDLDDATIERMNIPEKLYRNGTEFNEKQGVNNESTVYKAFRLDDRGNPINLEKEITTYSLGFFSDRSTKYFYLTDPKRKRFICEIMYNMHESPTWQFAARAI